MNSSSAVAWKTTTRYRVWRLFAVLGLVIWVGIRPAAQQEPAPGAAPPSTTVQEIETRLYAVPESAGLDDAAKAQLTDLFNQTLEQLRLRDEWQSKAQVFRTDREGAPDALSAIQAELSEAPVTNVPPLPDISDEEPLADPTSPVMLIDIEPNLVIAESALTEARARLAELEQEPAQRAERRRQVPTAQASARQRLDETTAQPPAAASSELPEIVEARRLLQQAKEEAIQAELIAYDEELRSYDARSRLLALRIDRAKRIATQTEREVESWRALVNDLRQIEAERAAADAREAVYAASQAPPQIRELAEALAADAASLTDQRTGPDGILRKIERTQSQLTAIDAQLGALQDESSVARTRADAAGRSNAVGVLLRTYRSGLPNIRAHRGDMRLRAEELANVQIEQFEAEEERRALPDIDAVVSARLDELAPGATVEQRERFAALLRGLYQTKRDALDATMNDYTRYFELLIDLDTKESELIAETEQFLNFIDERVLWIRSGTVPSLQTAQDTVSALGWLIAPERIVSLGSVLWRDLAAAPFVRSVGYLAPLVLLLTRHRVARRLNMLGETARKPSCTRIMPTIRAALDTLLLSLAVPGLIAVIGWRMSASTYGDDYPRVVGSGLLAVATVLWVFAFARAVLRENGLASAHLGWASAPCLTISRHLIWLQAVVTPLVFVVAAYESLGELSWQESAGRLAFCLMMVAVAYFAQRVLRPRGGALLDIVDLWRGKGRMGRRRFWYTIGLGAPAALGLAALFGYYYSALRIAWRVEILLAFSFGLLLVAGIALRATLVAKRRLAREQAKRRLEALRAQMKDGDAPPVEEEVDLDKVDAQSSRLVRSAYVIALLIGAWLIWADFLPALGVLDEIEVWSTTLTEMRDVPVDGEDGATELKEVRVTVPITWRDIVVALLIGAATFLGVQNLPGLLEIALLQRLPLQSGERYAVKTLVSYALVVIGVIWVMSTIGIGWSRVQWLVAAVGLGLGFGLQEIFANFVAGLIILFERPIRVGDTVTIGDVSGTVTKIRIRATWITAFNRKELVVPNKEFVTGQLVNWTLTDEVLRIEIPVGIAYGSDTRLARKLLYEVAHNNELVMKDPNPEVYFTEFGDNTLNFELRVFSPDLASFVRIKDDMHQGIDDAFRKAGIEFAFPQQDVHIRSIEGALQVKVSGEKVEAPEE